jgi:hypothetical protein
MKKLIARAMLGAALVGGIAAVAGITAPTAVLADSKPGISKAIAKQMQAVVTALQAKDYATASAKLNEAKAATGRTPYDDYKIAQIEGYIALNQNNHAGALAAYKSILDYADMPPEDAGQIYQATMELANEASDYPTAIKAGTKFVALGPASDVALAQLAVAYYYSKDLPNAKIWAQKSVDASKAANKAPDHGALQILQNVAADSKDVGGAAQALQQLVMSYNKPDDWAQLIEISYAKGIRDTQIRDMRRLELLVGAPMDAGEYQEVAQMQLRGGYPGEAKRFLEAGVAAGKVKSSDQSLATARAKAAGDEKSLASNDASAAKAASGDLDAVSAQAYYGYGRYAEAEAAAARSVAKGGRKGDPVEAPMLLAMSQAAEGKYADAQASFAKVPQPTEAQKNVVSLWTLYCKTKLANTTAAPAAH